MTGSESREPDFCEEILVSWEPYPSRKNRFRDTWEPAVTLKEDLGEDTFNRLYSTMVHRRNWLTPP